MKWLLLLQSITGQILVLDTQNEDHCRMMLDKIRDGTVKEITLTMIEPGLRVPIVGAVGCMTEEKFQEMKAARALRGTS